MKKDEQGVQEAISELLDNLGVIGVFMLGEVRVFLVKSWGASSLEFFQAVDQIARTMKQSGKMAYEDIDRAADKIKNSWDILSQETADNWDEFLDNVKTRLYSAGSISRDSFCGCVKQASEALGSQWTSVGRIGENQVNQAQQQIAYMASAVESQWDVFWDTMQKTGNKIDRSIDAAWEEIKK
jgi:hypothetical protein